MLKAALAYAEAGFSIIPVDPDTKRPIIASWKEFQDRIATQEEITNWYTSRPNSGIAIICGPISNLCVADADYYNLQNLKDKQNLRDYIALHLDVPLDSIPASQTPKGGEHYFLICPSPPLMSRKVDQNDKYLKCLDVKCLGGYVVVPPTTKSDGTSWNWKVPLFDSEGKRVSILAPKLYDRLRALERVVSTEKPEEIGDDGIPEPNMFKHPGRDESLFHVANLLVRGGGKRGEVYRIIYELGQRCIPPADTPGPQGVDIEAKVNSAFNRDERKTLNIAQLVRDYAYQATGYFQLESLYRELNLVSTQDKTAARVALKRMVESGELEKTGKKDGQYQIKSSITQQEIPDEPGVEFQVLLPLDIHNLVKIFPGNLILVYGMKDGGKTSFALHTAYLNMNRLQTIYLNIESDSTELRSRVLSVGGNDSLPIWKDNTKFISYEISSPGDCEHCIDKSPNKLYLIDYLDCSEDYTLATNYVNKIHSLIRGTEVIAIILAQTNPNKGLPFGGVGMFNRPRLVLSLEWSNEVEGGGGLMTIQSAKTPRHPELGHPRGWQRYYKIVKGGQFIPYDKLSEWFDPNKKIT